MSDVTQRVEYLRSVIDHHNHRYYVLDSPEISDAEYDLLMNELRSLEFQNPELAVPTSPTQRAGASPMTEFGIVEHVVPMLSLANVFSTPELFVWYKRLGEFVDKLRASD